MYNPHAFACERNKSLRIRKQEVGFRLSETLDSFPLFSLEEKEKEKERKLWCGAHPQQKISTIGANLHLHVGSLRAPPLHTYFWHAPLFWRTECAAVRPSKTDSLVSCGVARIRSKKLARSAQSCTCRWARCDLLLCTPATFSTSPFSGRPNARQYGPKKQTGSSAVVWRACGAKK